MKLLKPGMIATLILFTLMIGCKSDSDSSSESANPVATCSDGIQNQGEEGVDCGGPCSACPSKFTCTVNGSPWSAHIDSCWLDTGYVGPGFYDYNLFAWTGNQTIRLNFQGNATIGTPVGISNNNPNIFVTLVQYTTGLNFYPDLSGGSIKFTKIDAVNHKASGTFSFTVSGLGSGGPTYSIAQGEFVNIKLN